MLSSRDSSAASTLLLLGQLASALWAKFVLGAALASALPAMLHGGLRSHVGLCSWRRWCSWLR